MSIILRNFFFTSFLTYSSVGRKVPLSMFMIMGGASCILIQVLKNPHVIFLMALTGKLCIAGSFAVIYIHR